MHDGAATVFYHLLTDLYTSHAKSMNSIVAECGNVGIDSIAMNRYNLNIPTNSIMLIRTYVSTQSSEKNGSDDSIKSINQLKIYLDLF